MEGKFKFDSWMSDLIEGSWVRVPARKLLMVFVAQLARVPECGSGGREFDSHQTPTWAPVVPMV